MAVDQPNHELFHRALHREPVSCGTDACQGPVEVQDMSQAHDRVKTFAMRCKSCDWQCQVTGTEQLAPAWDATALLDMAYEHLMHQPAVCPFDGTAVIFTSLPNPRRQARYRLSCYYCGRQAEMDWPPQETRR